MTLMAYTDALDAVLHSAQPLEAVKLPLSASLGRVAASELTAKFDLPRFDNSMMDGYALRFEATKHASPDHPVFFPIAATIAAGDEAPAMQPNSAYAIMTGAAIPPDCNAVIAIENTRLIDQQVVIAQALNEHENIRFAGEDFKAGQTIVQAGERIHAGHIAVLASFGYGEISVYRAPTVGLISTGKEIVNNFDAPLQSSQIYNSNTPYLAAQLTEAGITTTILPHIADEPEQFKQALESSANDIMISTGAVSMGQWDFIPSALRELGATIIFHKVAQKPGKPILFARLADGRYFFGLPGNPASCAVGLRFFVQPLIRALQGLLPESSWLLSLSEAYNKKGEFRHFLKARVDWQNHSVDILNGQESFKISPLLTANAWVILTETQNEVAAHTSVNVVSAKLWPDHS